MQSMGSGDEGCMAHTMKYLLAILETVSQHVLRLFVVTRRARK